MQLSVDVDGLEIAYRSVGDGFPIVLLHGFLCDSRCWRTQLENLADQFRVVAWDAPGAGKSPDPPDGFTIIDWERCLLGFLDALDIDRAIILGLSWGGLLAQELYRSHPARVAALILCDTYAGWKGSMPAAACEKRLERCMTDSFLSGDELASRWAPEMFTDGASDDVVDEMVGIFRDFHPIGFRLMAKSLADTDTRELLRAIDAPTLLIWGEGDRRSPLEIAQRLKDAIPNADLALIPGAGHVSNMEAPTAFNLHVRRFCSSVGGSR